MRDARTPIHRLATASLVLAGVTLAAGLTAIALTRLPSRAIARDLVLLLSLVALVGGAVSLLAAVVAYRVTTLVDKLATAAIGLSGIALGAVAPDLLPICCGSDGNGAAAAIGSLRAVNSAQASFAASCANGGYAVDLADLVKVPPGATQGFISPDLDANGVVKARYVITMMAAAGAHVVTPAAQTCNRASADTVSGYFVEAHPVEPAAGLRSFASDTSGVIFINESGATITPGMAGAVPLVSGVATGARATTSSGSRR
jgi:hypothetical protein